MEQIKIEIADHKEFARVDFELKSAWTDIDRNDLKLCARLLLGKAAITDFDRGLLFSQLAVIDKSKLRRLGEVMLRDDDGVDGMVKFYDMLSFVDQERPIYAESLMMEYKDFTGPGDFLENIEWRQYAKAEIYFALFLENREVEDLDSCLSYLYFKDEYNPTLTPKVYQIIKHWPLEDKLTMFLNYMALRNCVMGVPAVDEETEKVEKTAMEALQETMEDDGPEAALKLPLKIAGEKIGTVDQINRMMVPDVFDLLDQLNKQNA